MEEKKETVVEMELDSREENQEEQNISFPRIAGRAMLKF